MPLLNVDCITFAWSHPPVLDQVSFRVNKGERIGLVGRNGTGKSTLLRLIAGQLRPDQGEITSDSDTVIRQLSQEVPDGSNRTVFEVAADGYGDLSLAVSDHHRLEQKQAAGSELTPSEESRFTETTEILGAAEAWTAAAELESLLIEMELPPDQPFDSLSAGMKRRVLLAAALIARPDILLLDEPTNHLDIESILWLQERLSRFTGTLIFITHDRVFLQETANRIIELDRGRIFDWTCDYQTFLKRRDELLAAEEIAQAKFDRKLAEEERWIRQGIKARRTRNEGRVRALKKMREQHRQRRKKIGSASMQIQSAEKSGQIVAVLENISHGWDDRPLLQDFSTTIFRGDRIGIIGPNGIGKSTLLKIILGELTPNEGSVRTGTNLAVAWFDQLRSQLDPTLSARDNVADNSDFLLINGHKRHVTGYLQDFLFSPERAQTRVEFLSGGERNRLLLAKLFTRPVNVLVLDEPTNDLDAETLELLEELLSEYSGTVLLVSHDRAFLNNVVTSTIVFEGNGIVREYDGGYDDWLRQRAAGEPPVTDTAKSGSRTPTTQSATDLPSAGDRPAPDAPRRKKLSNKEQRELESLPERIDELESRQAALLTQIAEPAFYQQPPELIASTNKELSEIESQLAECFIRWEQLEAG